MPSGHYARTPRSDTPGGGGSWGNRVDRSSYVGHGVRLRGEAARRVEAVSDEAVSDEGVRGQSGRPGAGRVAPSGGIGAVGRRRGCGAVCRGWEGGGRRGRCVGVWEGRHWGRQRKACTCRGIASQSVGAAGRARSSGRCDGQRLGSVRGELGAEGLWGYNSSKQLYFAAKRSVGLSLFRSAVAVTSPRVRVLRPSFARSAFLRVLSNEAVARSRSPARSRSISPQPVKMRCEVKSTVV